MVDRRQCLGLALGAGAALGIGSRFTFAGIEGELLSRRIPSSGERIPDVGLGSSAAFRTVAQSENTAALRDVLRTMVEHGATVFDTAPSYGASEQVAGRLARVMREESLDFIGVYYAVDNRDVEETILPLAIERGIAVMVYVPFGRTRLFQRVGDRPLPAWAADFGAASWVQFFIKYVLGHPAVTVVTPATSQARHMIDNLSGGIGRLPDAAIRKRMTQLIDALPAVSR